MTCNTCLSTKTSVLSISPWSIDTQENLQDYFRMTNTRITGSFTTARAALISSPTQPFSWARSWSSCLRFHQLKHLKRSRHIRINLYLSEMPPRETVTMSALYCTVSKGWSKGLEWSGMTSRHSMSKSTSTMRELTMAISIGLFLGNLQHLWDH
jgi:hypothetical protein